MTVQAARPNGPGDHDGAMDTGGEPAASADTAEPDWVRWTPLVPEQWWGPPAALAFAASLVIAVGGWWFGAGRYTSAPNLVGQPKAQALAAAGRDGFKVHTESRYDEKAAKDTVLAQTPGANQRIVKGGTITLTLSRGPERHRTTWSRSVLKDVPCSAAIAEILLIGARSRRPF